MVTCKRINPHDIPDGGFRILPLTPSQFLEIGWKAGIYAVNEFNIEVSATDNYAVAWSIHAAFLATHHRQAFHLNIIEKLWLELRKLLNDMDILDWQMADNRTQKEVVELMRQAEQNIGMEQIMPTPNVRRY